MKQIQHQPLTDTNPLALAVMCHKAYQNDRFYFSEFGIKSKKKTNFFHTIMTDLHVNTYSSSGIVNLNLPLIVTKIWTKI